MSKTYHSTIRAVAARPRSAKLREAGYFTAVTVGKNAGSNAGQKPIDSGSGGLFEEILDENGDVIGAKALYNLHIIQTPADEEEHQEEVTKDVTEVLKHLSLQVINQGQENEKIVLISDVTLVSLENIVSGGIGSVSGGGTGGGSLAGLTDVALSSPSAGQVLTYNATTSHWENKTIAFAISDLTDVAIGTPSNGQALIWDTPSGKWKPGNVASGATVVSSDATIGTGLTTIGTVDGAPIKAKIASYLLASDYTGNGTAPVNRAKYDKDGNTIASKTWVENKGYLTSSAISDMATMTWIGQQGFITSSAISDMATMTWVGQQGFITSSDLSGYATRQWCDNRYWTEENADARFAHSLEVSGANLLLKSAKSSNNTLSTITGENLVTAIGTNAVARATADAYGNGFPSSYLRKDIDQVMEGNLSIGAKTTTSEAKTLTIYGSNNSDNPAIIIHGVSAANISKQAKIWRDNDYLQIFCNTRVDGNFVATGYSDAGASASDRRLKKNIRGITLTEAEGLLSVLNPVVFEWNEKAAELGQLSGVSHGFIADEFLKLLPNAGRKMWGEYDALYYEQVIPYLVAGWQQQNLRLRIAEAEIKNLKDDYDLLRRRLREGNVIQ